MRLHLIKSIIVTTVLLAILSAMLCAPAGCKKAADDPSADSPDVLSDAGGGSDSGAGWHEPEDANEPIDPSMFDQVRSVMQLQVDGVAAQTQTLRQVATEHPDAQLTELVNQMEAKVAEAKKLMEKATSPAQSRLLKVDIPRLAGEASELAGKATARMQEVLGAKVGGG